MQQKGLVRKREEEERLERLWGSSIKSGQYSELRHNDVEDRKIQQKNRQHQKAGQDRRSARKE
jgi:hypothetical protein